jgi:uncharacterized protein involved in outer membrane biogenesis
MRRLLLISLTLLIVLVAVGAGIGWYLINDEAFLKSRLNAYVLKETGRQLSVDGPLRLIPGRETTVEAEGIRFANAVWADEPDMVRIGRLRVVIDMLSLFKDTIVIPVLSVEDCAVSLVEREKGPTNWDVLPESAETAESSSSEQVPVVLLDAQIRNCRLSHSAPDREQPLQVEIEELSQQLDAGQRWQIDGAGRIDEDPIAIKGWLSPARALVLGGPLEHQLDAQIGKTVLTSAGTLQDAATGQGANIELNFRGPEIANVLAYLDLPAVSSGLFDFRLSLDTEGRKTRLNIDGNLGSVQANAEGELDRLVNPTQGHVSGKVEGPDLALLGAALGVEGLAASGYMLDADVGFEPGLLRFKLFELSVLPADRLSVLGVLGTGEAQAGTDLDLAVFSEELGRWAAALGRPVRDIGPVTFTGRLLSDDKGLGTVRAKMEHLGSTLTLEGTLGNLAKPLQPDLNLDLHSSDPRALASLFGDFSLPEAPLAVRGRISKPGDLLLLDGVDLSLGSHSARLEGQVNPSEPYSGSEVDLDVRSPNAAELGVLFGQDGLPVAPFTLTGRVSRPGQRIRFEGVDVDLAGHRVHVDGLFDPDEKYSGSEFEVQLDTPDVAELALLFGKEGLPHEPMTLSGLLKPKGKGLQFQTQQGSLGDIRIEVDGHIPDLKKPLALDATFDIRLPSLTLLAFLAPEATLPDLPFTAMGRLQNQRDKSQLQDVQMTLGDFAAKVSGDLYHDDRFDVSIDAGGPDASQLEQWLGRPLVPEPFSLRTHLSGNRDAFGVQEIAAQLGESRASGNLQIGLGTPKTVNGSLTSPFLDLSQWRTGEKEEQPAASEPPSAFVFDDTKVMWVEDYGVDADVALTVTELDLGNTQLRDIELGFLLRRHRLELAPFSFRGERGGTFHGHVVLDDSGARPTLDVDMDGEDLRLGLTAAPGQDRETIPPLELDLSLQGSGFTRREMASSLHGKLRIFSGPGQVASAGIDFLFSDFLTELFAALNPLAETNEFTRLECSVWAADIVAGQVTVDPMITHIEGFTIFSKGTIDLQTEKVNLSFNTKPRKGLGITPGTVINTLIKVGGTLKKPAIELDPAGTIVGGTAAVATAGLSVLAKGFSDRFLSSKDPCGDARKELAKRDM